MSMNITGHPLTVGTGLKPVDFGAVVILENGGETRIVLAPNEARSFALALMDAAARAEAESVLARWLSRIPGMNEAKMELAFSDFRGLAAPDYYKSVRKAHQ